VEQGWRVAQGLTHGRLALADVFPVARHAKQALAAVEGVYRAAKALPEAENKTRTGSKSHESRERQ
jgi:hypothetical protein